VRLLHEGIHEQMLAALQLEVGGEALQINVAI
jgi:hypothetical protein